MAKSLLICMTILGLVTLSSAFWTPEHEYNKDVSKTIADSIKQKLLDNINVFADRTFAQNLQADLNNDKDSSRTVKEISTLSANQLFSILNLNDPGCDKNGDKVINGDELKCLNYAWKAYVPK